MHIHINEMRQVPSIKGLPTRVGVNAMIWDKRWIIQPVQRL
ncbi:MAG: hypothetical protein RSA84_24640 [Acinetobacter sp.]